MPNSVADLAALGKMMEEHRPRLRAMLCRRIDTAPLDPDTLLQETFLLACRRWPHFQEQSRMKPFAWLYRLALDCLIEAWRQLNRGVKALEMPLPEHSSILLALKIVSSGTSPSEAVARQEVCETMRQTLARLKPADREILWMKYYDGLTFEEVASILGISVNTAAKRQARALQRLSQLWQSLHGTE
jgi:RNA polymerase sigma-70 factor (ECF subfamily)